MTSIPLLLTLAGALLSPAGAAGPAGAADRRGDLRHQLARTWVDVEWHDAELRDAFTDLSRQIGVQIVFSRAARDLADDTVELTLSKVRARTLLKILADQFGFKVLQEGSILWVTTPEDAARRTAVLRIYDLRPILYVPPDFPGPRIGLRPPGELEDEPPPREIRRDGPDPSEIVDLLRRATGESQWEFEAVSIDSIGHTLVVKHSPSMHARVSRILSGLGPF